MRKTLQTNFTAKQFAENAIYNGYGTGTLCEGWDWIRDNLYLLDYVFQSPEYKTHNGMKYLCMPLLKGNEELSALEEQALGTAWYLNNQRETFKRREEHKNKMLKDGWLQLTSDAIKNAFDTGKRLHISGKQQNDWMSCTIDDVLKPFVDNEGRAWLMKPRAKRRGIIYHGQGEQAEWFYKIS